MRKVCVGCSKEFSVDSESIHCKKCDRWYCCDCWVEYNDQWFCSFLCKRGPNGEMAPDNACDECEYGDDKKVT